MKIQNYTADSCPCSLGGCNSLWPCQASVEDDRWSFQVSEWTGGLCVEDIERSIGSYR